MKQIYSDNQLKRINFMNESKKQLKKIFNFLKFFNFQLFLFNFCYSYEFNECIVFILFKIDILKHNILYLYLYL